MKRTIKRGTTIFLRAAVLLIGALVLTLCLFVLPVGLRQGAGGYTPIIIGMYLAAIPFFLALYHTLKLLNYIDQHKAFSELSVKALKYIMYCAATISALYAVGLPYIFVVAQQDDAPGVVAISFFIVLASLVIAVFAAVAQQQLHKAIAIKSENDLTV